MEEAGGGGEDGGGSGGERGEGGGGEIGLMEGWLHIVVLYY